MRRIITIVIRHAARALGYVAVGAAATVAVVAVAVNKNESGAPRSSTPIALVIDGMYFYGDVYEGPDSTRVDVMRDPYLDKVPEPDRSKGRPLTQVDALPSVGRTLLEGYLASSLSATGGYVATFAFGWPWRALQYHLEALEQGTTEKYVWRRSGPPRLLLPVRPAWPGVLGDVLVFAAAAGVLHLTGARLVSRLVRRAWRCTSCGYDRRGLAADAKCPECGRVPTT